MFRRRLYSISYDVFYLKTAPDSAIEYNGVISKTVSGYTCQRWDWSTIGWGHAPKVTPDPAGRNFYFV